MSRDIESFSVLVVDDDAMVRSILIEYLRKFGFIQIEDCKDGRRALTVLNNKEKHFDLVISDWEMPHADGLTVLKAVRKHPLRKNLKFIMVTSQSSQERFKITQAAQWKVDAYLVKPFRGEALKERIFAVLGIEYQKKAV